VSADQTQAETSRQGGRGTITLTGNDGRSYTLDLIDIFRFQGQVYALLLNRGVESPVAGTDQRVIMRLFSREGQNTLQEIQDRQELERVRAYIAGLAHVGPFSGKYKLEEVLGGGAFGIVLRAWDIPLDRPCAIKIMKLNDDERLQRFRQEARVAARLAHPNIVTIYAFDIEPQRSVPYIVMELLTGPTLQAVLKQPAPMPLPRVLSVLEQLAAAVDYAHGEGAVHRDIKPDNVFVGADDHVTVVDFGLGRSRDDPQSMYVSGTYEYGAPELIRATAAWKELDVARHIELSQSADRYAVGLVAYEMLAGRLPFEGDREAIASAKLTLDPPAPSSFQRNLRQGIDDVVLTQLRRDPTGRYPSATAFVAELRKAAIGASPGVSGNAVRGRTPGSGSPQRATTVQAEAAQHAGRTAGSPKAILKDKKQGSGSAYGLLLVLAAFVAIVSGIGTLSDLGRVRDMTGDYWIFGISSAVSIWLFAKYRTERSRVGRGPRV